MLIIKIGNRWFENVAQFKYLGTTITNENLIQEEIKRRLKSGNACYHSVQNLFSSRLLAKKVEVRGHVARMGEKRNAYRKARRKETTGKTKT
jgi:hypothetical protein